MMSDTARRYEELRYTDDLLETSQTIIENFRIQRETALKKQKQVLKALHEVSYKQPPSNPIINKTHVSPIPSFTQSHSHLANPSEFKIKTSSYSPDSQNYIVDSLPVSYMQHNNYAVPSYNTTSLLTTSNQVSNFGTIQSDYGASMGYFQNRNPVPCSISVPNQAYLTSYPVDELNPEIINPQLCHTDPKGEYSYNMRSQSVNNSAQNQNFGNEMQYSIGSKYQRSTINSNTTSNKPKDSSEVTSIDSQTLIRLLTGPKSDAEVEILKELARRGGFFDITSQETLSLPKEKSRKTSKLSSSEEKQQHMNASSTLSADISKSKIISKSTLLSDDGTDSSSVSTQRLIANNYYLNITKPKEILDCDDSSAVSSLPTTTRTLSSNRSNDREMNCREDSFKMKCKEDSLWIKEDKTAQNSHQPIVKESLTSASRVDSLNKNDETESEAESSDASTIVSPLPKKTRCAKNQKTTDQSILSENKETDKQKTDTSTQYQEIDQPKIKLELPKNIGIQSQFANVTYKFKSGKSLQDNNDISDEEALADTPKSFDSEQSWSQSSMSMGYKIQSAAKSDQNPFTSISKKNSENSTKCCSLFNILQNKVEKLSEHNSEDDSNMINEVEGLTDYETEKMKTVMKLTRLEKEKCKQIETKLQGIKLLESILRETTEKALSEQRELNELKKERRELRTQRKQIFSELSNQPLSETEMLGTNREDVSQLSLTCNSESRPTPSYPMNRDEGTNRTAVQQNGDSDENESCLATDRTDVLLQEAPFPTYNANNDQDGNQSSDTDTLSESSTVKLNFGDQTVRCIIDRVIETEKEDKSRTERKVIDPLNKDLHNLLQDYLNEMEANQSLQKELRQSIPNYDIIDESICREVHDMHVIACKESKKRRRENSQQLDGINAGNVSDILSSPDPPFTGRTNVSQSSVQGNTVGATASNTFRSNLSKGNEEPECSDDALFKDLYRQFSFLKDIKYDGKQHNLRGTTETTKGLTITSQSDIQKIQADAMRLMNSDLSDTSTPTTQLSAIPKSKTGSPSYTALIKEPFQIPNRSRSLAGTTPYTKPLSNLNQTDLDALSVSPYGSDNQAALSACSSVATSDLLRRVASEGYLYTISGHSSGKDKNKKGEMRNKRPRSRKSMNPTKAADLRKYLHADSSSDLTDFDTPRLPKSSTSVDKDTKASQGKGSNLSRMLHDRPSSASGRIEESSDLLMNQNEFKNKTSPMNVTEEEKQQTK